MGDFSVYTNYNPQANFSGVKFGSGFNILEAELNEMQEIEKDRIQNVLRKHVGEGIYGSGTMTYGSGTFTIANETAIVDGNLLNITTLSLAAGNGQSIYLDVWSAEIQGTYTIKQYGNQQTANTVQNYLIDPRMGQETTRRLQVVFNLSTVNNVAGHKYLLLGTVAGGIFTKSVKVFVTEPVGNAGGVPYLLSGIDSAKPSPDTSKLGRIYIATDSKKIYRDAGTGWDPVGGSATIQENFTTQLVTEVDASDARFSGNKKADNLCWSGQCIYASTPTSGSTTLTTLTLNSLRFFNYCVAIRIRSANNTLTTNAIRVDVQKNISGTFTTVVSSYFCANYFTNTTEYQCFYVNFNYTGVKATSNQIKIVITLLAQTSSYEVDLDSIVVTPVGLGGLVP